MNECETIPVDAAFLRLYIEGISCLWINVCFAVRVFRICQTNLLVQHPIQIRYYLIEESSRGFVHTYQGRFFRRD
ncbi:unnamed protein product [Phytomonas sp. Hart1]|nr:unnamed protein product [Phytomonas sp. Hart1]|eukprot:CCW71784.1 unnamed protein product [Phytomonas sp. isolate Hart1]